MPEKPPHLRRNAVLEFLRRAEGLPQPEELDLQSYRDYLRAGRKEHYNPMRLGEEPSVAHPSMFQPDAPVPTSDPKLATLVYRLLNLDPEVKANVSRVNFGPTAGTMRELIASDNDPSATWRSTLEGKYFPHTREIALNPSKTHGRSLLETIAHEILHAGGYGESGAREGEKTLYREKGEDWWYK